MQNTSRLTLILQEQLKKVSMTPFLAVVYMQSTPVPPSPLAHAGLVRYSSSIFPGSRTEQFVS